jgi:hypothetical protein
MGRQRGVAIQEDCRAAALPEIFRKIKINILIQFFVMRYSRFVKNVNEIILNSNTDGPPYLQVIRSKTYRGYVKPRIIPKAMHNVI